MQIYIGVDISKAYFDASIEGKHAQFTNDKKGCKQFIDTIPDGSWIVMESTGTYGYRLAETLVKHGFLVSIVNALHVKRFAQSRAKRAKTDAIDAKTLVEYAQSLEHCLEEGDRLRLWTPSTPNHLHLQQLRTTAAMLTKMRTMLTNQLEGLAGYTNVAHEVHHTVESLIKTLDKKIAALEEAIDNIIDKQYPDESRNLESIPGIARKSAATIIASIGDICRFANAKALAAFCGLCPRVVQSGSSVRGRGSLVNNGVASMRTQLYMCALSAIRWNIPCKTLYERLLSNGKRKKVALISVAHKLVRQIFAVLKYNTTFVTNYQKL